MPATFFSTETTLREPHLARRALHLGIFSLLILVFVGFGSWVPYEMLASRVAAARAADRLQAHASIVTLRSQAQRYVREANAATALYNLAQGQRLHDEQSLHALVVVLSAIASSPGIAISSITPDDHGTYTIVGSSRTRRALLAFEQRVHARYRFRLATFSTIPATPSPGATPTVGSANNTFTLTLVERAR